MSLMQGRQWYENRPLPPNSSLQSATYLFDVFSRYRMFFFELTVRSHDPVVGMGFSDHGETENADFMITWVDSNGKRHVQVLNASSLCFRSLLVQRTMCYLFTILGLRILHHHSLYIDICEGTKH